MSIIDSVQLRRTRRLEAEILRGPGRSRYDPSSKLILWCFLKEGNDIYQLLFTSLKNIDPSRSYRKLKVSAYV